jgi:hypothetical protein
MPTYTRADLKARINAGIKGKLGVLVDADQTINDAVRAVNSETDLRSTRRMVTIEPGVFDDVFAYPAPVDIKGQRIVSLHNQADNNSVYYGFNLVPYEQFNQKIGYYNRYDNGGNAEVRFSSQRELYTVAFDERSMVRRLLIAAPQDGISQVLTTLDSLTAGGGLWTAFGDSFNVDADTGNYVRGSGSIKYDINSAGGTTAGIYNATLTAFDITSFLATNSSYFTFAYISNAENITNFTLRIGNDTSNYYEIVVTATHANTVFATGWNTLRFDASNVTEVGTVVPDDCKYVALFMTKTAAKISQSGFRFDHVVARNGKVMELRYYSKYPWQDVAGVWKENSDEDTDFLNADADEYDMMIEKGVMVAGLEVDETSASNAAQIKYDRKLSAYSRGNPSEALVETSDYQAQYYL